MLFMSCVFHAFASVHCCLVVTGRERADLLALLCDVNCGFVTLLYIRFSPDSLKRQLDMYSRE